ncbi:MAG: universal stress protein [Isosphaerales bacterium]
MPGRILIGLDTPKHGAVLAELGIRWAQRCGAAIVGLGIVDEPGIRAIEPAWPVGGTPGVDPVYYMGYEARLAGVHQQVGQLLEQFAARCALAGVAHAEVKAVGSPDKLIAAEAQSCDLVVLARGSRFHFTARDDDSDEILRKVLKDTPRPIIVVPATPCPDGPVVIAYDGSLQAARALAAFQATGLGGLGGAGEVHIISVDASAAVAAQHAERAREFLGHHKIEAVPLALESSAPPAKVILEQVGRLNAGLLVMGAYGQPVLREFFLGSVTRTVLSETTVPLCLFH